MTATATPLEPKLAASLKVAAQGAPQRELGTVTLGEIQKWLLLARRDLHTAALHARGNATARDTIISAGQAVRAACDVFEAAIARGKL